ncbi:MAG: sugar phosphate isomerase/epimerase family protein [Pirellulaceae bacterium]
MLRPAFPLIDRRAALQTLALAACGSVRSAPAQPPATPESLQGQLGVTTGSFMRHLSSEAAPGKLRLLDLPRMLREELGMRVIDLMTATLPSMEPAYLGEFRNRAERVGCVVTNLKMNQPGLELAHADAAVRDRAITEYQRTMDAAQRLGCRWVRPLPGSERPNLVRLAESYRRLIDYGAPRGITLLVENYGWMTGEPDAIPTLLEAIGPGAAAAPDTGNWTDAARWDGLAKAFPRAVTCDFKAFALGPQGEHPRYDLRRCFQTGWDLGFRGPWCFEHFDSTLPRLWAGLARLRDALTSWGAASAAGQ